MIVPSPFFAVFRAIKSVPKGAVRHVLTTMLSNMQTHDAVLTYRGATFDIKSQEVCMTLDDIADETLITKKQVRGGLEKLQKMGLISARKAKQKGTSNGTSNGTSKNTQKGTSKGTSTRINLVIHFIDLDALGKSKGHVKRHVSLPQEGHVKGHVKGHTEQESKKKTESVSYPNSESKLQNQNLVETYGQIDAEFVDTSPPIDLTGLDEKPVQNELVIFEDQPLDVLEPAQQLQSDFEDWWAGWTIPGTKRAKSEAMTEYRKLIKSGVVDHPKLCATLARYMAYHRQEGTEKSKIIHPNRWLKRHRFDDEIILNDQPNGGTNGHATSDLMQQLAAEAIERDAAEQAASQHRQDLGSPGNALDQNFQDQGSDREQS